MQNIPFDAQADGSDGGINWDAVQRHLRAWTPQAPAELPRPNGFEPRREPRGCESAPRESIVWDFSRCEGLQEAGLFEARQLEAALEAMRCARRSYGLAQRGPSRELAEQALVAFREAWWTLWLAHREWKLASQQRQPYADFDVALRALGEFEAS